MRAGARCRAATSCVCYATLCEVCERDVMRDDARGALLPRAPLSRRRLSCCCAAQCRPRLFATRNEIYCLSRVRRRAADALCCYADAINITDVMLICSAADARDMQARRAVQQLSRRWRVYARHMRCY